MITKKRTESLCNITKVLIKKGLGEKTGLRVTIIDKTGKRLPARCVLKDGENRLVDPVGRGMPEGDTGIAGGFYVNGGFSCKVSAGVCCLKVESGYDFIPFLGDFHLEPSQYYYVDITLAEWFLPKGKGWYGGDIHFHICHGGIYMPVKTRLENGKNDYPFIKLIAQAEGLDYIVGGGGDTEEKGNKEATALSRKDFIWAFSDEKHYIWSGHVNIVGYNKTMKPEQVLNKPLPLLHLTKIIEKAPGLINYTHPVYFPDMNWLSGIEVFSHAVLGKELGLFDVGANTRSSPFCFLRRELEIQELFFFWSTGMKLGASAASDAMLEQGYRLGCARTYVKINKPCYEEIVKAMKNRHTIASAGPVFAVLTADNKYQPGTVVSTGSHILSVDAYAREGLSRIELIVDGKVDRLHALQGERHFYKDNIEVSLEAGSWVTVLARDTKNGFSLPTAFFAERTEKPKGDFYLLCITDANRALKATGEMFLHLIHTVGAEDYISEVLVFRNDKIILRLDSKEGNNIPETGVPLCLKNTSGEADHCETGWIFYPEKEKAYHLQLSLEIKGPGWYKAKMKLKSGKIINTGSLKCPENSSATTGILQFRGEKASLWLETCGNGCEGRVGYQIRPYCYCLINFKNSTYLFDQIGHQKQSNNFHRPTWVEELTTKKKKAESRR